MLVKLQNNCENPKTLEVYNKFISSPHCIGGLMYPSEEDAPEKEVVEITFTHYMEAITVVFNVETEIGEVKLMRLGEVESEEPILKRCGLITVDKLVELLSSLPHISDFMEDEVGEGLLH